MKRKARRSKCRWTTSEDALLTMEWGENSLRRLVNKLGRSAESIRWRARTIGLPCVPQGWVSVEAAAKHCGVEASTLKRICDRHGLKARRWYAVEHTRKGARLFVLLDAVVEAVETETRDFETITAGARRWGLPEQRLGRWLAVAGVDVLHTENSRRHYVRSADVDRVCKAHRWRVGRITVSEAARELGVRWHTLKAALGSRDLGRCAEYTTVALARRALDRMLARRAVQIAANEQGKNLGLRKEARDGVPGRLPAAPAGNGELKEIGAKRNTRKSSGVAGSRATKTSENPRNYAAPQRAGNVHLNGRSGQLRSA